MEFLNCLRCGRKLKRFSSQEILEEVIDGKICMAYLVETSEYSGLDMIDNHLKCLELKQRNKNETNNETKNTKI